MSEDSSTALEERRRRFTARTQEYLRLGHDRFAAAREVARAAGELSSPALVVGTGKGLLAMALARRGLDVVSVDLNREDSELAAYLAKEAGLARRIRFRLEDARALSFPDGTFGCALMMDVLHHLDIGAPVLREMARVVRRPEATIVVADFTEEGFDLVARIHAAEGGNHPRSGVTIEQVSAFLAALGWRLGGERESELHRIAWYRPA